jgi:hypothetical protein
MKKNMSIVVIESKLYALIFYMCDVYIYLDRSNKESSIVTSTNNNVLIQILIDFRQLQWDGGSKCDVNG